MILHIQRLIAVVLCMLAPPPLTFAQNNTPHTKGFVGAEWNNTRAQGTQQSQHAVHINQETYLNAGALELGFRIEARQALEKEGSTAFDIRELSAAKRWNNVYIKAGIDTLFWGVTESRHLVDIINQSDYRFDPDGQVKLGQLMVQVSAEMNNLTLGTYIMPCYRERAFANTMQKTDAFVDHHCNQTPDLALRASTQQGPIDIGITYFHGHARDPERKPNQTLDYPQLHHIGLDGQLTQGAWLWKLEAIEQRSNTTHRRATVYGLEYTTTQLVSDYNIGLLFEHLQDTHCTPLACGNMLGIRLGLNDESSSELLLTHIKEQHNDNTTWRLEASRRLSSNTHTSLELRHNTTESHTLLRLRYMF